MRDNKLNSLVYFEAVARRGAVALAAEELAGVCICGITTNQDT